MGNKDKGDMEECKWGWVHFFLFSFLSFFYQGKKKEIAAGKKILLLKINKKTKQEIRVKKKTKLKEGRKKKKRKKITNKTQKKNKNR